MLGGDDAQGLRLDDQVGPARRISARRAQQLIDQALMIAACDDDATAAAAPATAAAPLPRSKPRWWMVAAVFFVSLGGGSVATARYLARQAAPTVVPVPDSRVPAPRRTPRRPASITVDPLPRTVEVPPAVRAADAAPAGKSGIATTAAAWLERANAARAEGQWAVAERCYQHTVHAAPQSDAAYAAWMAIASLELEHLGDVRRAARIFRAQLLRRPDGVLAEEARLGLAESHRRLKRPDDERATLHDFLLRHPQSLSAARAASRLRELEPALGPPPSTP